MDDERIGRRWQKQRSKAQSCPDCDSPRLWLNHSMTNRFNPYWVECGDCHWCGKSRPTIRLAIRIWNKDGRKHYTEILKRAYGGCAE